MNSKVGAPKKKTLQQEAEEFVSSKETKVKKVSSDELLLRATILSGILASGLGLARLTELELQTTIRAYRKIIDY